MWRLHFYAGVFAAPILVLLAATGLVILYTQPLLDATQSDLRRVAVDDSVRSLDEQAAAVAATYPDNALVSVITPRDAGASTGFGLDDGRLVFVDPYRAAVLGDTHPDGGLVGLANRLHASLNNESITVPIPALSGLFGADPTIQRFALGDVMLEIFAVWGLLLAVTGIYLWWPRKPRSGKALFVPRLRKRGRARWRDLHAIPGVVLSAVLVFFVLSGLPWSAYWGSNYFWAAEEVSPAAESAQFASSPATLGDIDRFGNTINWALQDAPVGVAEDPGATAEPLPLATVQRIAEEEALKPGYLIALPEDTTDEAGNTLYGTYVLENSWPRKTEQSRSLFIDQFSGDTVGEANSSDMGTIARWTDYAISTHMGTQFGLWSRVVMTLGCVLLIWSVVSAAVMYWKRRRPGSLGLPRRPVDVRMSSRIAAIAICLGVVFPLWGVTALLVVLFDRWVVRRMPRLRVAFGQR
jgi:uncharacterized iron-regulated membrane protein